MKLGDSKAIKTGQWFPNEIFRDDDINLVGESTYQNFTDQAALRFETQLNEGKDAAIGGLQLIHNNLLVTTLKVGKVVSSQGAYLNADVWGFVAEAGKLFSVIIPDDQSVSFDAGGANDRVDVLEIRPIEIEYNLVGRNFKDPVTELVTSANVKTRKEYGFEFQILKGDDTSAFAYEQTTFTVNSATVGSNVAGKYILFSTVCNDYYVWFNTGASADPDVAGRIGIEVSIGAADDKDAIALAARTAIDGTEWITVSGATNQIILTGDTPANLTDSTNGDTGSYFDTISIVQGNGAITRTAGWIKVAEVYVAASATSIVQSDIADIRDSDDWDNDISFTEYGTIRAEDAVIEDAGSRYTAKEAESALQEIAGSGRTIETVKDNADDIDLLEGTTLITAGNISSILLANAIPYAPIPWNKALFAKISTPTHTGTVDTNLSMALKDVGADFSSVVAGAVVENTTDHVFATVLYKSGTDTLYLDWDAFPDGNEGYKVYTEPTLPSQLLELTGTLLDGDGVKCADTNTANHLLDADGTDWTTIMSVGDWAMNLSTGLIAKITAVAAHDLTLQWDCFPGGNEPYMLFSNDITISDGDSLINGAVIPEMNISGRFVRPGMTAGVVQEDMFEAHWHNLLGGAQNNSSGYATLAANSQTRQLSNAVVDPVTDGEHGDPRTGDETRPRNLSMVMVMRIK